MKKIHGRYDVRLIAGLLLGASAWSAGGQLLIGSSARRGDLSLDPGAPSGPEFAITWVSGNNSVRRVASTLEGLATAADIPLFAGSFNGVLQGQSSASYRGDSLTVRYGIGNIGLPVVEVEGILSDGQKVGFDITQPGLVTESAYVTEAPFGFTVVSLHRNITNGQGVIYSQEFFSDGDYLNAGDIVPFPAVPIGTVGASSGVDSLSVVMSPSGDGVESWAEIPFGPGTTTVRTQYVDHSGAAPVPVTTTAFTNAETPLFAFDSSGEELVMVSRTYASPTVGFTAQFHGLEADPALAPANGNTYGATDLPGTSALGVQSGPVVAGQQVFEVYTSQAVAGEGSLFYQPMLADGRVVGAASLVAKKADTSFTELTLAYNYDMERSHRVWTEFNLNTAASTVFGSSVSHGAFGESGNAEVLIWADSAATTLTDPADAYSNFIQVGGTASFADRPDEPGNTALQFTSPGDASFSFEIEPLTPENIQAIDDGDELVMSFDLVVDQDFIANDAKFEISVINGPLGGGATVEAAKYTVTGDLLDPVARSAQFVLHFTTTHDIWALYPKVTIRARMLVDEDPTIWLDNLALWIQAAPLPADLDGDGDVDGVDLGLFFANFTGPNQGPPTNPQADLDGDNDVDGVDLGHAFSAFTGPLTPTNVPEPASLALISFGGLLMTRRRA